MNRILAQLLLLACFSSAKSQTALRLGLTSSPTLAWAGSSNQLSNQFFTVSRAGFNGGATLALHTGPRLFFRLSASYSQQSFAIRQSSIEYFKTDVRNRIVNLEFPLMVGVSGHLGSLKHREYIGAGIQLPLSNMPKVVVTGDSASVITHTVTTSKINPYPVLIAGFEVGSQFKNDGALFFGVNFRYGLSEVYTSTFTSNRFATQQSGYNGTFLGFEVSFYFPRFSYWFKRDFTF